MPVMGGAFVFRGIWYGGYDFLKKYLLKNETKNNRIKRLTLATGVTIFAGYCCYPLDTIGRRMMM